MPSHLWVTTIASFWLATPAAAQAPASGCACSVEVELPLVGPATNCTACDYPEVHEHVQECGTSMMEVPAGVGRRALTKITLAPDPQCPDGVCLPVCNDGSTPVYYVRRSPRPSGHPDHERYLFFFEAGGSALDLTGDNPSLDTGFQRRWAPDATANPADVDCLEKMSTERLDNKTLPDTIRVDGLFDGRSNNPYRYWNWVYLNYCSSDRWMGRDELELDIEVEPRGPLPVPTTVHGAKVAFHGALIFDHVLRDLRDGVADGAWGSTEGSNQDGANSVALSVPLSQATHIVLAGEGSSSDGVLSSLDRVERDHPNADVMGLIGAAHRPWLRAEGDCEATDPDSEPCLREELHDLLQTRFSQVKDFNGVLDSDCVAWADAQSTNVTWQCQSLSFLESMGHISQPRVVRQDLGDALDRVPNDDATSQAIYRDAMVQDYVRWIGSGPWYMVSELQQNTKHVALTKDVFYDHKLVLCDAAGNILETMTYRDLANDLLSPPGPGPYTSPLTQAYDGLQVFDMQSPATGTLQWFTEDCGTITSTAVSSP